MPYSKEYHIAVHAVCKAGLFLKAQQDKVSINSFKGNPKDFATRQDLRAEKIIIAEIKKSFPGDCILSEEFNPSQKKQGRMWMIDPLDGTRNYANGIASFTVSVALWDAGELQVGAVYAPCLNDELFSALRGGGAFLNGAPLPLRHPGASLDSSLAATGFYYAKGAALLGLMNTLQRVLNRSVDVLRSGSAALDMVNLAAGRLGAYYEKGIKPWDIAGGLLIAQEQKCHITNHNGDDLNLFRQKKGRYDVEILAAKSRRIHSQMLPLLKL